MIIKKCVIEVENFNLQELHELECFLNARDKKAILKTGAGEINDIGINDNFERLKKFRNDLTKKQSQVFDYFVGNVGTIYSDDLKKALPMLQPHGALPGIFRATSHWVTLGGAKEDSPFFKLRWDRLRACGEYRGLNADEIQYLSKF